MFPELFTIGTYKVSTFLVSNIVQFTLVPALILILAKKGNLDISRTFNYILFGAIAAVLGAKLYSVLFAILNAPNLYLKNPVLLWRHFKTGGAFFGGLLVAIPFCIIYTKKFFKKDSWKVLDITVIGLALGQVIGRIGCFSTGCCYGKPTSLPWGVKFPYLASKAHPFSHTYIHPTQIYEAVLNLCNFLFLFLLWKKQKREGVVSAFYLINYGIIRFFVEYLRSDGGRGYLVRGSSVLTSLSYPQVISIILVISGIIILRKKSKKKIESK
jgi:phosphatidylglycerol:prolipoprotein diacylglycerol transferase